MGRATVHVAPRLRARASERADSAVTVMKALSRGLIRSIRSRQSFVSSTGEMAFFRTRSAASARVRVAGLLSARSAIVPQAPRIKARRDDVI